MQNSNENFSSSKSNITDALEGFRHIIKEAKERRLPEPTSISLATADASGKPSVRTVYLVTINELGPVIFINTESGKGKQLVVNPFVALCMHVPELQKQIILEGEISGMTDIESDDYWNQRSRDTQLASWASDQAATHESREELLVKRNNIRAEFSYESIPRPENWKALQINPTRIEYWDTGWHRLRQRRLYTKQDDGEWGVEIENP